MNPEPQRAPSRVVELAVAALVGGGLVALGVFIAPSVRPAPAAPPILAQVPPPAAAPAPVRLEPQLSVSSIRILTSSPDRAGAREYALDITLQAANLPEPPANVMVKVEGEDAFVTKQTPDTGYDLTLKALVSGSAISNRINNMARSDSSPTLSVAVFDRIHPEKPLMTSSYTLTQAMLAGSEGKSVPANSSSNSGAKIPYRIKKNLYPPQSVTPTKPSAPSNYPGPATTPPPVGKDLDANR